MKLQTMLRKGCDSFQKALLLIIQVPYQDTDAIFMFHSSTPRKILG